MLKLFPFQKLLRYVTLGPKGHKNIVAPSAQFASQPCCYYWLPEH